MVQNIAVTSSCGVDTILTLTRTLYIFNPSNAIRVLQMFFYPREETVLRFKHNVKCENEQISRALN